MKKGELTFLLIIAALILTGVPAGLFYYYDNARMAQLNAINAKIMWAENQKEVEVIKAQVSGKLEQIAQFIETLSEKNIKQKYSPIIEDRIIKNYSYSKQEAIEKIREQFQKNAKQSEDGLALLFK
ncbi:MAG TPA: hypothetical protein P5511_06030, partial [Candidatus Goldiibacteriota bacterium]|nr:hypothetical protein [Candidatus Goldiibacteriota bacterium]